MEDCHALVEVKELVEKLKLGDDGAVAANNVPDAVFCKDVQ